jgi:hypothetical protein
MIILGLILLLIGVLVGIPILYTLGVILLIIGLVLMVMGRTGTAFASGRPSCVRGCQRSCSRAA